MENNFHNHPIWTLISRNSMSVILSVCLKPNVEHYIFYHARIQSCKQAMNVFGRIFLAKIQTQSHWFMNAFFIQEEILFYVVLLVALVSEIHQVYWNIVQSISCHYTHVSSATEKTYTHGRRHHHHTNFVRNSKCFILYILFFVSLSPIARMYIFCSSDVCVWCEFVCHCTRNVYEWVNERTNRQWCVMYKCECASVFVLVCTKNEKCSVQYTMSHSLVYVLHLYAM